MAWDSTKTENWEAPVEIVWLNDAANIQERLFVLVCAWAHIMEGVGQIRCTIAPRVVYCANEWNLPTWAQVVHEAWPYSYLKTLDDDISVYGSVQGGASCLEIFQSGIERVKFSFRLIIAVDES